MTEAEALKLIESGESNTVESLQRKLRRTFMIPFVPFLIVLEGIFFLE